MTVCAEREAVHARGLAVGSYDLARGRWLFHFREERFTVSDMTLERGPPQRFMRAYPIPEVRYGWVAGIDEVRRCSEERT